MYNLTYETKYNDVDMNGIVKPSAVFEFFEDVAAKNANFKKIGYDQMAGRSIAWFLLKYRIEFDNYPQNIKKIIFSTDPRGGNKNFSYRNFCIHDEQNNLMARASSVWAVVDLETKKILNPMETFPGLIPVYKKGEEDLSYAKIPMMTEINYGKNFNVEYFDIDINRHVNNSKYVSWALETLPVEFLNNKIIKTIDVVYKKEITLGNIVSSQVQLPDENTTVHKIINSETNEDLTNILISWE